MSAAEAAAVVKADAYGCGAAMVAPALAAAGCRTFFAAAPLEAVRLKDRLPGDAAIYVLNGFSEPDWPEDPRIKPVLNTFAEAQAWTARRRPGAKAALQLETGMNRIGLTKAEQAALLSPDAPPPEAVDLILSHLAITDRADAALLAAQKPAFDAAAPPLSARFPAARRSLAATAGAVWGEDLHYDLIRPGVGLYGGLPFAAARPALRLSAPLIRVWEAPEGAWSGYGGAWTARRPSVLGAVPLGYADGLPRALAGRGAARIGAERVPLIGRVSMDYVVLDLTDLPAPPPPGARAFFLDETMSVDAMAEAAGTIGYEILTRLDAAGRLERRYL